MGLFCIFYGKNRALSFILFWKMATLSHKYLAGLNNSQFSKLIKEQKSKQTGQIKKVRSLLTTIEHYLFAWDKVDCCLLVKNLLDADSWAEDTKDSGTKSSKDRFLVCNFYLLLYFWIQCFNCLFFCVIESHTYRCTGLSSWKYPSQFGW